MSSSNSALATTLVHLNAGLYFQVAAFVVLVYDHLLTFSDEVERIWKRKISGVSILFFLNKYFTMVQYTIFIAAFHSAWKMKACARFVKVEGALAMTTVTISQSMMILRVYALYGRSTVIAAFLLCLLAVQLALGLMGLLGGIAVPLPSGVNGCILTGTTPFFGSFWVAPLVIDSCIFFLTLRKTHQYIRSSGRSFTLDIFIRDGAMYFVVIFGANLMNTLLYFLAPPDLKAMGASFCQLITSVMVSRLVLNLRSITESTSTSNCRSRLRNMDSGRRHDLLFMTTGNLGGDFHSPDDL